MTIAIIGGGNMGEAFARGIHEHFEHGDFEVIVSEHNTEKHATFHKLEIRATGSNLEAVEGADIVILAVKPKDMEETCRGIASHVSGAIIISIAAGVSLKSLTDWLGTSRVVRVMPNLLASIGKCVSVWFGDIDSESKLLVQKLLESIGTAVEVTSEDAIDQGTAISGCGPAYVWYMMEKMISAGVKIGLPEAVSREITMQTFLGASEMAAIEPNFDPQVMRTKVASKGGTTEQAIRVFDEHDVEGILEEAVMAAYERAKELGK